MTIPPTIYTLVFTAIGIFGITFLIAIHEFGHFLFCKLFSIHTPSFSIGFGPKLVSKRIGDTVFSLSAFPLGGYVEIAGHEEVGQGTQAHATDRGAHSFASKPYYQKLFVVFGGIIFNILFAYATIIGILLFQGEKPILLKNLHMTTCIESLEEKSPASRAGLLKGDVIISINDSILLNGRGHPLIQYVQSHPGETANIQIKRQESTLSVPVTFGSQEHGGRTVGSCGITLLHNFQEPKTVLEAIKSGVKITNTIMHQTIQGFFMLFKEKSKIVSTLSGPVAIIALTTKSAAVGLTTFLLFIAIISINLAIINLLPIPLLDGGQIVLVTVEALAGHRLSARAQKIIRSIQFFTAFIICLLFIYITWQDIMRIIAGYRS